MAESKIKDENYFQVSGWMLNRLRLKGILLEVYAIIYGFSQDGQNSFTGSLQYLSDFTNTTKPTVIKALKELVERGYVLKFERRENGVKFNSYKADLQVVKNLYSDSKEPLPGGSKETLPEGSKEILPNNKDLNNKDLNNKKDNYTQEEVDLFFESIWKLYPEKKGKGKVSASKRRALCLIGFEEMKRAIDRYLKDLKKDAAWRKPQHGSTFFNTGYIDYLDANYEPSEPSGGEEDRPDNEASGGAKLYGHYI